MCVCVCVCVCVCASVCVRVIYTSSPFKFIMFWVGKRFDEEWRVVTPSGGYQRFGNLVITRRVARSRCCYSVAKLKIDR